MKEEYFGAVTNNYLERERGGGGVSTQNISRSLIETWYWVFKCFLKAHKFFRTSTFSNFAINSINATFQKFVKRKKEKKRNLPNSLSRLSFIILQHPNKKMIQNKPRSKVSCLKIFSLRNKNVSHKLDIFPRLFPPILIFDQSGFFANNLEY